MPKIVDLDLPSDKLADLARDLLEKFRIVERARRQQLDSKAVNWTRNYDAIPAQQTRTVPFYRASNFMPHLIRMHSDILGARILGILFGTKPFWMVKTLLRDKIDPEILNNLSLGMNYLWDNELAGFEMADNTINQALQTGTLVLKNTWNDDTMSYMDPNGAFQSYTDAKMAYDPIPFEDFWPYPITALSTARAEILFQRLRFTKQGVIDRKNSGKWIAAAADRVMFESKVEPIADATAQSSGITLTSDADYPYTVLECWTDYEIGGQKRPIIVTLNPQIAGAESVLRAIYNFYPYGERPFVDFVPMRRKGSFFGYAVPEILEQSQEEQAQIHNSRRDANTIANVPSFKKKRYADVPNPATDWYPGCILELDEMDDLEVIEIMKNYNSAIDEEQFVMSLAERYVGISPSMQGFGAGQAAGKRGIYATGATLALLSEGNRRIDIFIKRMRYPFHRLGRFTALSYNQFAPGFFDRFGDTGNAIKQAFQLTDPRNGSLLYDLAASDASANREVDRQSLLQMAGIMGTYYERITQAAAMVRQLQEGDPLRETILMVLDGARHLANQILFQFDQGNRELVVPNLRSVLGGGAGAGTGAPSGGLPGTPGAIQPAELENVLKNIAAVSSGAAQ